ncbi:hypothetical protein Xvie_03772 [Xenorhabdus vietnamensis]|uniref:Uncharacterized protein n=2 Tax=Xenorhabdus TaxID=626 RepID=A0A1Y2S6Y2_9GAMM|nr:hypothetical protein [Xenorhabdus vietnamensis]OTA14389.1 hypothetical protein Xvie_03772 [Xenorhabdus vietnamensis]BET96575.1 hypothetical protein TCT1_14960 [Xenorhabdus sp. TCT-1]
MQEFWEIFGSAPFVAIAWVCTVVSCIYAFVQKSNVTKIKQKFNDLNITHNELKIQNTNLEQKIIEIEKNDFHDNYQEVHQHGQNNFNQGVIKGDFIYNK